MTGWVSPQICWRDDGQTDGDEVGDDKIENECDVGVEGPMPFKFELDLAAVATKRGMICLYFRLILFQTVSQKSLSNTFLRVKALLVYAASVLQG